MKLCIQTEKQDKITKVILSNPQLNYNSTLPKMRWIQHENESANPPHILIVTNM